MKELNTMTSEASSQEVYRLEIDEGGDGIVFHVKPSSTILEVMTFICTNWLNEVRNGDGGVDEHLWKFYQTGPSESYPNFEDLSLIHI